MSGSNPLKSYSLSVAQSDIPSTWMPDSRPRLANVASRRIVSIASQSGTVNAGQPILVALPYGMGSGFLCSGSAYAKFKLTVTQTAGAVANSWAFKQSGSGSSVFQRISAILSGQQAEVVHNYGALYNSLLQHATNQTYLQSDARVHDSVGVRQATSSATVCVPLGLGCLNAKQHLPLFLLNGSQLQFDTNSIAAAITQLADSGAVTNYAISEFSVCFEQLVCEPQYEQSVKAMLAQGRIYQMPIDTWFNTRVANATSITQNIGLNSSSVRCILWGSQPVQTAVSAGQLTSAVQSSCFIYADGQLVHNANLNTDEATGGSLAQSFAEMNRCLNVMFDTSRTSSAPTSVTAAAVLADLPIVPITRALYAEGAFLGGLSLQRESIDNQSFSFVGTPVSQLVFQWAGTPPGNTGEMFIFVALQQVLTIDAVGSCNLIR
jgi:hypothetical protein